jgi:hypothetical protein
MIPVAIALTVGLGPLLLALAGALRARRTGGFDTGAAVPWSWTLTLGSALLYTLAFNLTFFIQELFLVLPKAFLPGVRPTLFHNNHDWEGENPLTSLFQGTGALAIFASGIAFALLLRQRTARSSTLRLFCIWMAYHGLFQSLPQVPWGALNTGGDVGVAMDYLRFSPTAKAAAALASMALIPPAALWLTRHLLGVAGDAAQLVSPGARTRAIFQVATLPALIAMPLIILFRIPRSLIEVLLPPAVAMVIGIVWAQAGAWCLGPVDAQARTRLESIRYPLAAVLALLLVFQLVLRRGIPFY